MKLVVDIVLIMHLIFNTILIKLFWNYCTHSTTVIRVKQMDCFGSQIISCISRLLHILIIIICAFVFFQTFLNNSSNSNDHQRSRGGRRWPRAPSPLAVQPPGRGCSRPQSPHVVRGTVGVPEIGGASTAVTAAAATTAAAAISRTTAGHTRVPAAVAKTGAREPS